MRTRRLVLGSLLGVLAGTWGVGVAVEQAPAVKRSVLQKHDLRPPGFEGVMALVEIPVGGRETRHTHPAEVFLYVMEGTLSFDVEGQPTTTLKPGESFFLEAGKIHEGINRGDVPVKVVAVFATEKGKPLTTPAK
jgi:quercetin dioxygenase-like cupin family protein